MTLTETGPPAAPSWPDDPGHLLYDHLLRTARTTGRCPVWIRPDDLELPLDGPTGPAALAAAIGAVDPDAVLDRWWPGPCRPGCPCGERLPAAIPRIPGPAGPDRSLAPATFDAAVDLAGGYGSSLAVVDAARPADVPAALGWPGICNYVPYQDLVSLSAVLRHWEDRWGAVVVALNRSRMTLSVAYPPTTDAECTEVAAEHIAFCPDQQDPQNGDYYTLSIYSRMIRGAGAWSFWWD
ncbi:DUF4253 domain-containing protein [Pseudonocardia alni]|uniref:DUF4253 domain-containing protein n=1 Tax=Pseudonocardia alni TaxID=33907 RepID=UPI001AD694A1|nr:DUF4253 domain-containing protein [Pseudonocardia alni]MBO4238590.1 DUF4253 domain-containing protein [Pseudonocardia alni]